MLKIRSGNADAIDMLADERTTGPCFFVGVLSTPAPHEPELYRELPDGLFLIQHQFNAHACSQVHLWGIFLPVVTSPHEGLRTAIQKAIATYGECADCPSFDEFAAALKPIIPSNLKPSGGDYFDMSTEAKIIFENPENTFQWLRENQFRFITELEGTPLEEPPEGWRDDQCRVGEWTILETQALPWSDLREFSRWFSGDGRRPLQRTRSVPYEDRYVVEDAPMTVALIYENSD
ncbi:MAG: hypothetical protein FD126_279 [Elusimicrobia bacterium]|nr:MAG: hypothetical protein FD126_279 [Elusimicrobiota bacterium]